jgi:23S rRNA pseudouridine1911/1915/1917 synthase
MKVLFCDNHVLVVEKEAGIPTQPSKNNIDSVEDRAKLWIKKTFHKQSNVFLHAVHRIDKPVSGLVLFARTSKSLSRLNESMRDKKFIKTYLALVDGVIQSSHGSFQHFLYHAEYKALIVPVNYPNAKKCSLSYKTKAVYTDKTLVEIDLDTGRYHQIRAQFSKENHPICGDIKYGSISSSWLKTCAIALHQAQLSFPHPISKEMLTFSSSPEWLSFFQQ